MFFLRRLFNRVASPRPRPTPRARPTCESLEDRLTPATTLTITCTDNNDIVRFVQLSSTRCRVLVTNANTGVLIDAKTFSTTGVNAVNKVIVLGKDGDDKLNATKSLVPVVLQGGAGKDKLFDSGFSDILIGGPDDDILRNRSARDLLIGSEGADNLKSTGAAGAILFGGLTSFTVNQLNSVRAEWNSSRGYALRVSRILNNPLNWGAGVSDDGAVNTLIGSTTGRDWFLKCPSDPAIQNFNPQTETRTLVT
jgi:Ca2+-binding RTX toxin-like protein